MKKLIFIFVFLSLAGAGLLRADAISDGNAIVVNQDVITSGEISQLVEPQLRSAARMYAGDTERIRDEVNKVRDQQIEDLIDRKLIVEEFTSSGYATNVLESFIDDMIKKKIQQEYYGDRARLIKTLQAEGVTYEMYRRREKETFIVNYMAWQNVDAPKKTLISPLKIERYYQDHQNNFKVDEQIKLRLIVIPQPVDGQPGQADKTAREILDKINSGVPFAEMASVYTAGSQRAQGGERGWVERSYFKPELATVAFSLKPGQHSGVVSVPEASYLIEVEDIRSAHVKPLMEVRTDIERDLRTEERSRLRKQWIARLKAKSFVRYY